MAPSSHTDSWGTTGWSILGLSERRTVLLAATCFANVVLAVMGDLLFAGGSRVMSAPGGGVDARFASLRAFTASTLAEGQLPLWNPAVFSGMAHVGGFESGLYYPPNLVYRILPLASAINFGVAIHLFLFAMFTFLWLRRLQIHAIASIYGGVVAMLSGVFFLHASSGDLSVLEALTWCPAALLAVHSLSRGQFSSGVVGGGLVFTMQILCGYPIASLYTGLAALFYGSFLFAGKVDRGTMIRGGLIVLVTVPFLAAIQLWVGIETFAQSTRLRGDTATHIASKAFDAQDLFTVVVPWADVREVRVQTANIFIGVITLIAGVYGLVFGTGRFRFAAAAIAGILLVLAFVPRLAFFAGLIPGAGYVVEPNLFALPALLFVIAIASIGLDRLIHNPSSAMRMAGVAIAFTVLLCAAAIFVYLRPADTDAAFRGLLMAAGVSLFAATLLSLVPVNSRFRFAFLAVGLVELYVFAVLNRPSMTLEIGSGSPPLVQAERVLGLDWRNPTPLSETYSASGNAALVSERYLALLAHTQWVSMPKHWDGPFEFVGYHPLHRMLRIASVSPPPGSVPGERVDDLLPRFLLIGDYVVAGNRAEAFAAMDESMFDPWRTVVLEGTPAPVPQGDVDDVAISVNDESVNRLIVEVELEHPAILLMTDAYDRGWRARGLTGSSQWQYDVMPANVALRAIPLGAGSHRIELEYAPLSFRIGQWVSVATAAGFMLVAFASVRRRISSFGDLRSS